MKVKAVKAAKESGMSITTTKDKDDWQTTTVKINHKVEVATVDGWLNFWVAGREIRIGPLTSEQASKLSDDLGYEAVE